MTDPRGSRSREAAKSFIAGYMKQDCDDTTSAFQVEVDCLEKHFYFHVEEPMLRSLETDQLLFSQLKKSVGVAEDSSQAEYVTRIEALKAAESSLAEAREKFEMHTNEVGKFLSEMYATMIDPLDDGNIKVAEMCKLLLATAREQREQLRDVAAAQAENARLRRERDAAEKRWAQSRAFNVKHLDMIGALIPKYGNFTKRGESVIKSLINAFEAAQAENARLREGLLSLECTNCTHPLRGHNSSNEGEACCAVSRHNPLRKCGCMSGRFRASDLRALLHPPSAEKESK
jgi:hypothetical protein